MLGIVHGCYGGISGHVAAGGAELGAAARDSFATPPPNVCSQQPTIITMSQGFEMTNHKRVASEVATQCEREHAKPSLVYDACGRGDALEAQQAHVFIGVLLAPGGCGDGAGAAGNGVAPTATFLCAFVLALVELGDLKFSITRSLAQPRDVVARSLARVCDYCIAMPHCESFTRVACAFFALLELEHWRHNYQSIARSSCTFLPLSLDPAEREYISGVSHASAIPHG